MDKELLLKLTYDEVLVLQLALGRMAPRDYHAAKIACTGSRLYQRITKHLDEVQS